MNNIDTQIQENVPLIYYFIQRNQDLDRDEMLSVGLEGLKNAILTFDDKKLKFSTYAYILVEREINKLRKKVYREKRGKQFNHVSIDDPDTLAIADLQTISPSQIIVNKDLKSELNVYLKKLNDRARQIVIYFFGLNDEEPKTKTWLAQKFGVSDTRINNIIQESLEKIRFLMRKELIY